FVEPSAGRARDRRARPASGATLTGFAAVRAIVSGPYVSIGTAWMSTADRDRVPLVARDPLRVGPAAPVLRALAAGIRLRVLVQHAAVTSEIGEVLLAEVG